MNRKGITNQFCNAYRRVSNFRLGSKNENSFFRTPAYF